MLLEWFQTTWVYQHYLLFVLPVVFVYAVGVAVISTLVGAIRLGNPSGYVGWATYLMIWAHIALAVITVPLWFYQLYLVWY